MHGLVQGRKILVTGVFDENSLGFAIAKQLQTNGAKVLVSCHNKELATSLQFQLLINKLHTGDWIVPVTWCDVNNDDDLTLLKTFVRENAGRLDGIVHSIANAPLTAFRSTFTASTNRRNFTSALESSTYSLIGLTKALQPFLTANSSIVALSYLGSTLSVPHYNVMGIAKSALEATVRYLAADLGKNGTRVNIISPGPHKTFATSVSKTIDDVIDYYKERSPLKRNITSEEVGNVAVFLCSDLSKCVTGEVIYADGGFSTTSGIPE